MSKKKHDSLVGHETVTLAATSTALSELRQELNLILKPDFTDGDFYPRLDRRLIGRLPEIAKRSLLLIELLELAATDERSA